MKMKGITCCGECTYYSLKKHRCNRGCVDESDPRARFYGDCPLPDVQPVEAKEGEQMTKQELELQELRAAYKKLQTDHRLTPQKLKRVQRDGMGETYHDYACPNCGALIAREPDAVYVSRAQKYCFRCGQAFEWVIGEVEG